MSVTLAQMLPARPYTGNEEINMNLHVPETPDTDEFDFSASYGTAVTLVSKKTGAEVFRDLAEPGLGHLIEQGEHYPFKHPKAA